MSSKIQINLYEIFDRWKIGPREKMGSMFGRSIPITLIEIMLNAAIIDGCDAAIDSPVTRLGQLPRDIRDYMIRPLLWKGDRYLGIEHRNGYRYGVQHKSPYLMNHNMLGTASLYYNMGLLHRDGAPAAVHFDDRFAEYWQHGRMHRDDGPAKIWNDQIMYCRGHRMRSDVPSIRRSPNVVDLTFGLPNRLQSLQIHPDKIRVAFYYASDARSVHDFWLYKDRIVMGYAAAKFEFVAAFLGPLFRHLQRFGAAASASPDWDSSRDILARELIDPIFKRWL